MSDLWYPKAEVVEGVSDGGEYDGTGPPRGVIHTTEGSYNADPSRWVRNYYHLEYKPSTRKWRQNIPFNKAARSLRNPDRAPNDTETNRNGIVNIQFSIHGRASEADQLGDWALEDIAEFMAWSRNHWKIPAVFPYEFGGSSFAGESGDGRLTVEEWENVTGWVGHQHVTENTHWDPGLFPVTRMEDFILMATLSEVLSIDAARFWQGSYDQLMTARNELGDVQSATVTSIKHMLENDRGVAAAFGVKASDEVALRVAFEVLLEKVEKASTGAHVSVDEVIAEVQRRLDD